MAFLKHALRVPDYRRPKHVMDSTIMKCLPPILNVLEELFNQPFGGVRTGIPHILHPGRQVRHNFANKYLFGGVVDSNYVNLPLSSLRVHIEIYEVAAFIYRR